MVPPTMQYVIGKPQTGRTTYLIHQFLAQGHGAFFDFTGDVDALLDAIPPDRWDDTVLFLPTDTQRPVGFNILHNAKDKPRIANAVLETIKSTYHYEGATPLLDMYLYSAIAALLEVPDATLLGTIYLFTNDGYRKKVVGHIKDPVLLSFWRDFYESIPEKDRRQTILSTINKFYGLLTDPTVRNIVGQKHTSFTIKDTSFLIASFPPQLGTEKGSFLATLLLHSLPDFPVILDGGHRLGMSAVTGRDRLTFCHQYLAQLTHSVQELLIGSARELVAFQLGPTDAERLACEFDLNRNVSTLTELAPFVYHAKRDNRVLHDQRLAPPSWPLYDGLKLGRVARNKYSKREHVEEQVTSFVEGMKHATKTKPHPKRGKRPAQ